VANEINNTKTSQLLNPWFITGFTNGEGCFGLYIYRNAALKIGWYTFLDFKITLHVKDRNILEQFKKYFGVGVISKHGKNLCNYSIKSIKDIQMVINHFDTFPLKTNKLKDYKFFKKAYYIIKNKEHLTKQGLEKLILIKSSMNLGLSPELKLAFPIFNSCSLIKNYRNISTPILGKVLPNSENFEPNWVAGFASGEGSFQVNIRKIKKLDNKYQVLLTFSIGQHGREELLLKNLANYLGCGRVQKKINSKNNTEFFEFSVSKFKDVNEKIIFLFLNYPIQGQKILDFQDFCNVANLMNKKSHLTNLGLNQIRLIKQGMNSYRI
jgi:hypothetical protein